MPAPERKPRVQRSSSSSSSGSSSDSSSSTTSSSSYENKAQRGIHKRENKSFHQRSSSKLKKLKSDQKHSEARISGKKSHHPHSRKNKYDNDFSFGSKRTYQDFSFSRGSPVKSHFECSTKSHFESRSKSRYESPQAAKIPTRKSPSHQRVKRKLTPSPTLLRKSRKFSPYKRVHRPSDSPPPHFQRLRRNRDESPRKRSSSRPRDPRIPDRGHSPSFMDRERIARSPSSPGPKRYSKDLIENRDHRSLKERDKNFEKKRHLKREYMEEKRDGDNRERYKREEAEREHMEGKGRKLRVREMEEKKRYMREGKRGGKDREMHGRHNSGERSFRAGSRDHSLERPFEERRSKYKDFSSKEVREDDMRYYERREAPVDPRKRRSLSIPEPKYSGPLEMRERSHHEKEFHSKRSPPPPPGPTRRSEGFEGRRSPPPRRDLASATYWESPMYRKKKISESEHGEKKRDSDWGPTEKRTRDWNSITEKKNKDWDPTNEGRDLDPIERRFRDWDPATEERVRDWDLREGRRARDWDPEERRVRDWDSEERRVKDWDPEERRVRDWDPEERRDRDPEEKRDRNFDERRFREWDPEEKREREERRQSDWGREKRGDWSRNDLEWAPEKRERMYERNSPYQRRYASPGQLTDRPDSAGMWGDEEREEGEWVPPSVQDRIDLRNRLSRPPPGYPPNLNEPPPGMGSKREREPGEYSPRYHKRGMRRVYRNSRGMGDRNRPLVETDKLSEVSDSPDDILDREIEEEDKKSEIDEKEEKSWEVEILDIEEQEFEEISEVDFDDDKTNKFSICEALDTTWSDLISDMRPPAPENKKSESALKKFWPLHLLSTLGLSTKYARPEILNRVTENCLRIEREKRADELAKNKSEMADSGANFKSLDEEPFPILHPIVIKEGVVRVLNEAQRDRSNMVANAVRGIALSNKQDLIIRRRLCNLPERDVIGQKNKMADDQFFQDVQQCFKKFSLVAS